MSTYPSQTTPVIIAVVVTGRVAEFARLLDSMQPLASDPDIHLVVLDNGLHEDDGTAMHVARSAARSAGMRVCIRASRARLPLHAARKEISYAVACAAASLSGMPFVWMIDDDLTFEEVRNENGMLVVRNVALSRVAAVRQLAGMDIDIVVSGFTGDPPVRPESVLAGQLIDLQAAAVTASEHEPSASWPLPQEYVRNRDDYYDHSESADGLKPPAAVPWLPRAGRDLTVRDQLASILEEACSISRGCTPFRPLLAIGDWAPVRVQRADRGGNTIFRGVDPLLAHPYPAFPVCGRFSRRSDMVGLNLLASRGDVRLAKGCLTLRHDRTLQASLTDEFEPWLAEFGGVLLSRATAPDCIASMTFESLGAIADRRADRIARSMEHATQACEACLGHLGDSRAWHRQDPLLRVSCERLEAELRRLSEVLASLLRGGLDLALRSGDLRHRIWMALAEIRDAST